MIHPDLINSVSDWRARSVVSAETDSASGARLRG
jgi:hypothetical protein